MKDTPVEIVERAHGLGDGQIVRMPSGTGQRFILKTTVEYPAMKLSIKAADGTRLLLAEDPKNSAHQVNAIKSDMELVWITTAENARKHMEELIALPTKAR